MNVRTRTLTVGDYMTENPATIGSEQSLEVAHELMRKINARHLPVLHGGKLVGLVSQRDLYLIGTFGGAEANQVRVEEAMTAEVFTVGPDESLSDVASAMAKAKIGCAVVVQGRDVVGIFSVTDALSALSELVGSRNVA